MKIRKPLKRRKPLRKFITIDEIRKSAKWVKPMKRLRPGKAASRARFRKAVLAKNWGYCARCTLEWGTEFRDLAREGGVIKRATDAHHHLPLGRGGKDEPENGIPLCRMCHDWLGRNPVFAEAEGWLLKRGPLNANSKKIKAWLETRKD